MGTNKKYYESPVQVRFYLDIDNVWMGGIAYKDEIICCKCGSVIKINEMPPENIIEEKENWSDMTYSILYL